MINKVFEKIMGIILMIIGIIFIFGSNYGGAIPLVVGIFWYSFGNKSPEGENK